MSQPVMKPFLRVNLAERRALLHGGTFPFRDVRLQARNVEHLAIGLRERRQSPRGPHAHELDSFDLRGIRGT